jgi:hypothetical protein
MSQLRKATRQKAKIRLGLSAVSGGGKTYSALLIAYGLCGDWNKIAIIDTENNSADLYAHLGEYNVLPLPAPYPPEKYIEAIKDCQNAGMEVIIIDSITHEWDGKGGILDISSNMTGNSFTNWAKLTPRHQAFLDAILQSPCHVLTTVRRKQDYEMSKNADGKSSVTKAGLKEITREGFEYELTVNLEIDVNHNASASKDRTGLFAGKPSFIPTIETGELIKKWCDSGAEPLANIDARPELNQAHPNWQKVVDAIKSKQFTLAQVQTKYRIVNGALAALEALENPAPPNAPVFQPTMIIEPVAPVNGTQRSPEPF